MALPVRLQPNYPINSAVIANMKKTAGVVEKSSIWLTRQTDCRRGIGSSCKSKALNQSATPTNLFMTIQ
jgi:hypothetical protein